MIGTIAEFLVIIEEIFTRSTGVKPSPGAIFDLVKMPAAYLPKSYRIFTRLLFATPETRDRLSLLNPPTIGFRVHDGYLASTSGDMDWGSEAIGLLGVSFVPILAPIIVLASAARTSTTDLADAVDVAAAQLVAGSYASPASTVCTRP